MRSVELNALKKQLSETLRIVAEGETVLITDRERVVAELGPPKRDRRDLGGDARLAEAVRNGLIRLPVMRSDAPPACSPVMKLSDLIDELAKDRDQR